MKGKSLLVGVVLVMLLGLVAVPGSAAAGASRVAFTGTETAVELVAEGDWIFLPSGNVHVRGATTVYQEAATDWRMSGLNTGVMNANWGPDFAGPMWGTFESVLAETGECPGGGIWQGTWTGTMNVDGSYTYAAVGRGVSGCVAGLHVSLTASNPGTGEQTTFSGEILDPHGE